LGDPAIASDDASRSRDRQAGEIWVGQAWRPGKVWMGALRCHLHAPGIGPRGKGCARHAGACAFSPEAEGMPRAYIIAGPNGAGKTTFARGFLLEHARCATFINADLIAAGLSPLDPQAAAVRAMRMMSAMIEDCVRSHRDFAVETTLAGRSYIGLIRSWRATGYQVNIIFLRLPSADAAVRRVAQRVQKGGHDVPEPLIRQRYDAGWRNFADLYRDLADAWSVYDSSHANPLLREQGARAVKEPTADVDPMSRVGIAMLQAAQRAREDARRWKVPLILVVDGQVVEIPPDQIEDLPGVVLPEHTPR
jgi:predicted ABC-type ATPase